jgi:hypothetical protein
MVNNLYDYDYDYANEHEHEHEHCAMNNSRNLS